MVDYTNVVVGAGSAGAVLASRVAEERGRSVLLLEAGLDYADASCLPHELTNGHTPAIGSHDWGMFLEGPSGRLIHIPRGKVIGGSSSINSCIALRPDPADFDCWCASGLSNWSWRDVLPYFKRLENDRQFHTDDHGREGPVALRRWTEDELSPISSAFLTACEEMGYERVPDLNRPGTSGVGILPMNLRDGKRLSTAVTHLFPSRARPNFHMRGEAFVTRVLFDHRRAIGVECLSAAGKRCVIRAEHVTLSAGAYGTPAILWRSGIGPADRLIALGIRVVADMPGVGMNLQDHSQCYLAVAAAPDSTWVDGPCAQVLLRYTSSGSDLPNDMQLCVLNVVNLDSYSPELAPEWRSTKVAMICPSLQAPTSRGTVVVNRDPTSLPRVQLDYVSTASDRERYREGFRIAWRLARGVALKSHVRRIINVDETIVESDERLDVLIRRQVQTSHHPVGTAKIGLESDSMAVVDSRCRVKGVEGLSVADASVMPTIVRSNTNLTCMMIGERVGEWLST